MFWLDTTVLCVDILGSSTLSVSYLQLEQPRMLSTIVAAVAVLAVTYFSQLQFLHFSMDEGGAANFRRHPIEVVGGC